MDLLQDRAILDLDCDSDTEQRTNSCWSHIKSTFGRIVDRLTCGYGLKLAFALIKEFTLGFLMNGVDVGTDVYAAVKHFRYLLFQTNKLNPFKNLLP